MSNAMTSPQLMPAEYSGRWKWFLALGMVLLAFALVGATAVLDAMSVLVFVPMLLVSSIMQLLTTIVTEKGKETFLHNISAAVELVLGFIIMARPHQSTFLAVLTAFCLVVMGLTRLGRAVRMQTPQMGWLMVAGAFSLLLGSLLGVAEWLKVPAHGVWLVAVCLALDFACYGVSWSAIAFIERRQGRDSCEEGNTDDQGVGEC
jgi:uncharacterized membrane protein HdeD (DUF308 family)